MTVFKVSSISQPQKGESSLVAFNYLAVYGEMQWHDLNESNWRGSLHPFGKLPTLARWCFLRSDLRLFIFLSHGRSASLRALLQIWFGGGGGPFLIRGEWWCAVGSSRIFNRVTRMGSHIFGFLGVKQFFTFTVSKRTRMFVLWVKSKVFFIQYKVDT